MSKRKTIPFEVWTSGREGHILFCVEHFRLASRQAKARGFEGVYVKGVYKMEYYADAHEERFGHTMRPVVEARELAAKLDRGSSFPPTIEGPKEEPDG